MTDVDDDGALDHQGLAIELIDASAVRQSQSLNPAVQPHSTWLVCGT